MANFTKETLSALVNKLGKPNSAASIFADLKKTVQEHKTMGSKISGVNYLYDSVPNLFNGSLVTVVRKAGCSASEYEVQIVSMGASILYMPAIASGNDRYMRQYDLSSKNDIDAYIGGILKKYKTDGNGTVEVLYYKYDSSKDGDTFHGAFCNHMGAGTTMQRRPSNAESMRMGPATHYTLPGAQPQAQDDLMSLLGLDGRAPTAPATGGQPDAVDDDFTASRGEESASDAVAGSKTPPHRKTNVPLRTPEQYIKALVKAKG